MFWLAWEPLVLSWYHSGPRHSCVTFHFSYGALSRVNKQMMSVRLGNVLNMAPSSLVWHSRAPGGWEPQLWHSFCSFMFATDLDELVPARGCSTGVVRQSSPSRGVMNKARKGQALLNAIGTMRQDDGMGSDQGHVRSRHLGKASQRKGHLVWD